MEFKQAVSAIGKPRTVAEALTGKDPKWVAEKFGVSLRTAQKWVSGKGRKNADGTYSPQAPSKRHGGTEGVMRESKADARARQKIAANAFRTGGTLFIGPIKVVVSDENPTPRKPKGPWRVTPRMREGMNRAADALDRGDLPAAEREMNKVVLREYADNAKGKPRGGGKLSGDNTVPGMRITDWGAGFDVV